MPEAIAEDRTLGRIDMEARFDFLLMNRRRNDEEDLAASNEAGAQAVKNAVLSEVINKIKCATMFNASPEINEFARDLINRINPGSLPDSNIGDPNGT